MPCQRNPTGRKRFSKWNQRRFNLFKLRWRTQAPNAPELFGRNSTFSTGGWHWRALARALIKRRNFISELISTVAIEVIRNDISWKTFQCLFNCRMHGLRLFRKFWERQRGWWVVLLMKGAKWNSNTILHLGTDSWDVCFWVGLRNELFRARLFQLEGYPRISMKGSFKYLPRVSLVRIFPETCAKFRFFEFFPFWRALLRGEI